MIGGSYGKCGTRRKCTCAVVYEYAGAPEVYENCIQEAIAYLEQREEKIESRSIRMLGQYYKNHPEDTKKTVYWVKKSSETGSAAAQIWLAEAYLGKRDWGLGVNLDLGEYYLGLAEKNPNARTGMMQAAKRLRAYLEAERERSRK